MEAKIHNKSLITQQINCLVIGISFKFNLKLSNITWPRVLGGSLLISLKFDSIQSNYFTFVIMI